MSKHPIPDWLRSQFSRIEDEVHKLGPCGVFTQMRTVTQTYFEQAAAAPQPPALGGEPEILGYSVKGNRYAIRLTKGELLELYEGYKGDALIALIDRAHLAPLQAEIERLKACIKNNALAAGAVVEGLHVERDHLKARCDEVEKDRRRYEWIRSQGTKWSDLSPALFERVNDECNPPYMALKFGEKLDSAIDACMARAALSKPAGSESV